MFVDDHMYIDNVIYHIIPGYGGRLFLDYDSMHQEDASVDRLWEGGKKGVLPVFVLCHCFDGEEVMDTTYLGVERGQRWLFPIILVMFIGTVL
jgi:hypothetical protein